MSDRKRGGEGRKEGRKEAGFVCVAVANRTN